MRIILAIRAFFAILLGKSLDADILLAATTATDQAPSKDAEPTKSEALQEAEASLEKLKRENTDLSARAEELETQLSAQADEDTSSAAAVRVLAVMQSEARLLDFISEDISDYSDEDVGGAVRDVHRGLQSVFKDHFPIVPVRAEEEDAPITIPEGFNPHEFRLVGNVVGEPPFSGTLSHRGWRVEKVQLPKLPEGDAALIACAAEVEV